MKSQSLILILCLSYVYLQAQDEQQDQDQQEQQETSLSLAFTEAIVNCQSNKNQLLVFNSNFSKAKNSSRGYL